MKVRFLVAAAALLAGCVTPGGGVAVSSSPSPVRDAAVGCWRLASSPGLLGRPLPTTVVRLDTVVRPDGGMRMLLLPDPAPIVPPLHLWGTAGGGGALVLSFSNGFSGVVVRASLRGHQLKGRGRTWTDASLFARGGRVHGVRVPCPPLDEPP